MNAPRRHLLIALLFVLGIGCAIDVYGPRVRDFLESGPMARFHAALGGGDAPSDKAAPTQRVERPKPQWVQAEQPAPTQDVEPLQKVIQRMKGIAPGTTLAVSDRAIPTATLKVLFDRLADEPAESNVRRFTYSKDRSVLALPRALRPRVRAPRMVVIQSRMPAPGAKAQAPAPGKAIRG